MTGRDHDQYRELVAAHVLGALDHGDRVAVQEHLRTCDPCRQDALDLAPLPALLARIDPDELAEAAPSPAADRTVAAVRAELGRLRTSRRRWRWVAVAAAVAAVALVSVTWGDAGPAERGGDREAVALDVVSAAAGAEAEVLADERAWGTYVHVSVDGLPRRDAYEMWVVGSDGRWEAAGTWARTPDGEADLGASSQYRLDEIDRVVITSVDRADEFVVARS